MAFLYGVTVNINHDVHDEWLAWMKEQHVPDVMKTGMFTEYRICRLIGDAESGGVTYNIQYVCDSLQQYQQYQDVFAPALQAEHTEKFKDRFVAFRTILEIIE